MIVFCHWLLSIGTFGIKPAVNYQRLNQ